MEAVVKATLYKPHGAGYTHHCGSVDARRAIALHHSSPEYQLGPDHVIVTNGCSGALDLILETLLDDGSTLLVPNPAFPLYQELAEKHGANVVQYRLDPNKQWECDLSHLEEIMTSSLSSAKDVRALIINNPSSPTGSVFSERHLEQLLSFALRHRLPIVSDEVYGTLTFGTNQFYPMAQIAARYGRKVPIITASGLSKQFMLPGWRVGWLTFQDNTRGSLQPVEQAAQRLMQLQHGVNQLAQAAIPPLLSATTPGLAAWKEKFRSTLERQGMLLCSSLNDVHCLKVSPPQGAMYAICQIRFDRLNSSTIGDDIEFASKLVEEENVFVLPGSTFGVPGTFRVAYSASEQTLETVSKRISDFCHRHSRALYSHSYSFPSKNRALSS
jgi:tyrosine aminotransferase